MLERKPHHTDADWEQYGCTMDAITTRKPGRMKRNGMEMLAAKVGRIRDAELRADAQAALDELAEAAYSASLATWMNGLVERSES